MEVCLAKLRKTWNRGVGWLSQLRNLLMSPLLCSMLVGTLLKLIWLRIQVIKVDVQQGELYLREDNLGFYHLSFVNGLPKFSP